MRFCRTAAKRPASVEIENIQINKTGQGPELTSVTKVGDVLLIQSQVDDRLVNVIRNKTGQPTYWDFRSQTRRQGRGSFVPPLTRHEIEECTSTVFTVAQDVAPDFSESGQLWYDTAENELKVWDEDAHQTLVLAARAATLMSEKMRQMLMRLATCGLTPPTRN